MGTAQERKIFQQLSKRLTVACGKGDLSAIREIVKKDPKVVAVDTSMLEACLRGQYEAVSLLIELGASVDPLPSSDGNLSRRPLTRVLCRTKAVPWTENHRRVLELLLDKGARTDALPGWDGASALSAAARGGNKEGVRILLDRFGPPDFFDAAAIGDIQRVADILQKSPEMARQLSTGNTTALQYCAHSALGNDDPELASALVGIAEMLLAAGTPLDPVNAGATGSYPAAYLAIKAGNFSVVKVLLDHGADPGYVLERALIDQVLPVLEMLEPQLAELDLDFRVDNNLKNPAVNQMIRDGMLQSAAWLLDHGADPNQKDLDGFTALHYAARRGVNTVFLENLLNCGAVLNALDNNGRTPVMIAEERRKEKAAAFLRKRGAGG